jgi:hypothetical protein
MSSSARAVDLGIARALLVAARLGYIAGMAYSKSLAARVRHLLSAERGLVEKRMFGGVVFMLHGNMCLGVWEEALIARLGISEGERALKQPHVRPFDVTGKPMRGWILIDLDGLESDRQLGEWIGLAVQFVRTLPPK